MQKFVFSLILSFLSIGLFAQHYEIKVVFKPFKNQYIYLGSYMGKTFPIVDSVLLDENSAGTFKGDKKLGGGIYLIGYPNKSNFFEILIDKEQEFSIYADSADLVNKLKFENSPDNVLFNDYQKFLRPKGKEIDDAKNKLTQAATAKDSAKWNTVIKKSNDDIQNYRKKIMTEYPDATLTFLFNVMKEPAIPPATEQPGGKYDSAYVYQYYKKHYWDGVQFYDERLVRTPASIFEAKLDKYYETVVFPNADSVIKEMDRMLGFASINEEMQRFLLVKFVNRYINQKYMWEDKVFVHLFEKYFSQKEYPWLTEQGKKTIFDRAYSLMANILGNPAPDISLADSNGKIQSLFSIENPYTVVCFWDPTCSHCKETLPRIDSIYRAKWKQEGVQIMAIAKESDGSKTMWKDFISLQKLEGWIHVYYSKADEKTRVDNGIPGYMQLYDVISVPTLYLLDKEKRILAKKIPFEQIDEVLEYKIKAQ